MTFEHRHENKSCSVGRDTLDLNEQEVYKNVSGVLLSVPKDFFKFPLNAPTQKIIGWEIFVQSQSEHFIHVQKQVSKRRSNMHKIKKIRSLCFVNFWWNLRKCKHFFILSITKSCFKMLDCGIICHFLINLFLRIFFQMGKRKICQTVWIRNIENTVSIKLYRTRLIQAQNEKVTALS